MGLRTSVSNSGISIMFGESPTTRRARKPEADQTAPRGSYVYGHVDANGVLFYVGNGTGRRAWSDDRHHLWHRYVTNCLRSTSISALLKFADELIGDNSADGLLSALDKWDVNLMLEKATSEQCVMVTNNGPSLMPRG